MREIKFRIWDTKHDCMYWPEKFSEKIVLQIGGVIGLFNGSTYDTISPKRFIVDQYTGLHDKNGKEIYEGDIVKCGYGTGSVIFANGCFIVNWIDDKFADMELLACNKSGKYFRRGIEVFEVIGSIHENPELIK